MKTWKKILIGFFAVLLIALIAGFFFIRYIATRSIPDYNRDMQLNGLKEPVTVYRDAFAIPHIYAANEEDLYRVVGYLMAQDRLWQMDTLRRLTQGRLAEIFGKDLLETDQLMRSLQMKKKANRMLAQTDPEIIRMLDAFSDGVNQYIDDNHYRLPPEFTLLGYKPGKWTNTDSACMAGYMGWGLTTPWDWETLLFKLQKKLDPGRFQLLIPDMPLYEPSVFPGFSITPPAPGIPIIPLVVDFDSSLLSGTKKIEELGLTIFSGSNNWAISRKKSTTGYPVLANDMHLGYSLPSIWYPMHQIVLTGGKTILDVTGVVLPGQPFVIAGHNQEIAWGMTNVMVDDMDFYCETLNPANPDQYKFNGEWIPLITRKEIFRVKGGEKIEKELKYTHRGPVVSGFQGIKNYTLSMHWIGFDDSNELRAVYLLNRAANWSQFRDALKTFITVSQNVVYADQEGNIGLQTSAGVPIRKQGAAFIVPGDTDEYDWKGIVPFDQLPYSFNPDCGYVSSANNKTTPDDYPYYISSWFDVPDRIIRIREMLEEKQQLSVEDLAHIQGDFKSKLVHRYLGDILAILKNKDNHFNELEKQAIEILVGWDGEMNIDSPAATIFETMFSQLIENLVKDELGNDLYTECLGNKILLKNLMMTIWTSHQDSSWLDNINTPQKETFNQWVLTSFQQTVEKLKKDMDDSPWEWQWGKKHTFNLAHPLGRVKILNFLFDFNRGPFEVGGSFHTVCPYGYSLRRPFSVNHGASQRHIYSLANWDESLTIIPAGVSGIPASPHYSDQVELYTSGRYHPDYYSKPKVVAGAKYVMTFNPKTNDEK